MNTIGTAVCCLARRIMLVTLVGALALVLAGCSSSIAGKYVDTSQPDTYFELKGDGTFFAQVSGTGMGTVGMSGTYEVNGDDVILKAPNGFAEKLKREGSTLVGRKGTLKKE